MICEMNITSLRPKFIKYTEPLASFFIRFGVTPNQVSLLSLLFGFWCALAFTQRWFLAGSLLLVVSAILDLVDGNVARRNHAESKFGAVFDWIADKYVDAAVILGVGFSGIPIVSQWLNLPPIADFGIVGIALVGSLINTFIKPVVYAEIGYSDRIAGKIEDPLEGVGFFGRPETVLVLVLGGVTGLIWAAVIVVAVCTNLSALQRIVYLYRRYA
jgi:archaetidylinositol phosphate synthase